MSFVKNMPIEASAAFDRAFVKRDATQWLYIVRLCVEKGITDPDKLADIPFHLAHPELHLRDILSHESDLKIRWKACRIAVMVAVPFVKDAIANPLRWDGSRARLREWLKLLNPQRLHVDEGPYTTPDMVLRTRESRIRFHSYICKAFDDKSYETKYLAFNYNTIGILTDKPSGYPASKYGYGSVGGLVRSGKFDALDQLLQFARKETRGNERRFATEFKRIEKHFWDNVYIGFRWVDSGASSDGSNNFKKEVEIVTDMYKKCLKDNSIYSVHRDHIVDTYKQMTVKWPSSF